MLWWSYAILAYLALAIHVGLAGYLDWAGTAPNLVLPIVVFVVINASRREALLGAFLLGLGQDLFTQQPAGIYALSYGMAALFMVGMQPSLNRDHALAHFFLTLFAGGIAAIQILLIEWAWPVLHGSGVAGQPAVGRAALGLLFTVILAPFILGALGKVKFLFCFEGVRHRTHSFQSSR
jgi:rod shape-determining protein MreD